MENENVKKLIVPEGVQYISEWADYELPKGELALIRAFYEEYVEELSKNESMCPMMMF